MTSGRWLRLAGMAALAACSLLAGGVRADSRERVVLLDPPDENELDKEVVARVRGELSAAGFDVVVLPIDAGLAPRDAVETLGREFAPAVVVVLTQSTDATTGQNVAEVWFTDHVQHRTLVQRLTLVPLEPSRGPARLAVQVVELLKARHAELAISKEESFPKRATEPQTPAAEPPTPPRQPHAASSHVVLSLGAGMLQDVQASGRVWLPILRVGAILPELGNGLLQVEVRGTLSAFGEEMRVEAGPGLARFRQNFALLDGVVHFGARWRVQPLLSLGAGAYSVDVVGEADPPNRGRSERTWSGLAAAGGGVWAQALPWLAGVAEAQLLSAWSKTVVRVTGEDIASPGEPMLFLSAAVVGIY